MGEASFRALPSCSPRPGSRHHDPLFQTSKRPISWNTDRNSSLALAKMGVVRVQQLGRKCQIVIAVFPPLSACVGISSQMVTRPERSIIAFLLLKVAHGSWLHPGFWYDQHSPPIVMQANLETLFLFADAGCIDSASSSSASHPR